MKNFLKRLFDTVTFIKVMAVCLSASYFVFWFYRFFNLPYVDYIYPIFDILLLPIKSVIETVQIDGGRVNEMGYLGVGFFMIFLAWLFSRFEAMVVEMDRRYDLKVLYDKQKLQRKANEEMTNEYVNTMNQYDNFSVLIVYKIDFLNELIAQTNNLTIPQAQANAYNETANYIRKNCPKLGLKLDMNYIFIKGKGYENFDETLGQILNGIKMAKIRSEKDFIKLDFSLVLDSQTNDIESTRSFEELMEIANAGYYNKAVVTPIFKHRFDLIKEKSKYTTDMLGFSANRKNQKGNSELYIIKTKPTFI